MYSHNRKLVPINQTKHYIRKQIPRYPVYILIVCVSFQNTTFEWCNSFYPDIDKCFLLLCAYQKKTPKSFIIYYMKKLEIDNSYTLYEESEATKWSWDNVWPYFLMHKMPPFSLSLDSWHHFFLMAVACLSRYHLLIAAISYSRSWPNICQGAICGDWLCPI